MNPIELGIFASRLEAVCDEMGAVLRNAAFSTNIRDRLDFSCAVFDSRGELCAQAAHIPVHLGSMAYAMRDIVTHINWASGDQVMLNDPYLGGTHLPDITMIAPVIVTDKPLGFVVNRAHHADIGAEAPGSMPLSSTLDQEGQVIAPVHLVRKGIRDESLFSRIIGTTRNPAESAGDFAAQLSANRCGETRLGELIQDWGLDGFRRGLSDLNAYAERLAKQALKRIPDGVYEFEDLLDDDGQDNIDIPIRARIEAADGCVHVDFSGTSPQVSGNVNCPLSVAAAAVYYVFRCLMPPQTPACSGTFRPISLAAPTGCLLNAEYPAAVAAGNVETSTRVVDVIMGALAQAMPLQIPAASQGSMNNLAMGQDALGDSWDYYETIGGGMGAGAAYPGLSAVQTHMTNTLNSPIEVLESRYPLRVQRYAIRRGSGGAGAHPGGDGLIREFRFLSSARVSLVTERRRHQPWGLAGGAAGDLGVNRHNGRLIPGKLELTVEVGDTLTVETPGGGGWGRLDRK